MAITITRIAITRTWLVRELKQHLMIKKLPSKVELTSSSEL